MIDEYLDRLSKQGYSIYHMKHAYRINGIVDLYKHGNCVYDKRNNTYHKFDTLELAMQFAEKSVHGTKPEPNFKQNNGKISYKEFKRNEFNAGMVHKTMSARDRIIHTILHGKPLELQETHAEDYHWRLNEETTDCDMYIVFHRDMAKIGKSKNVRNRIEALSTGLSHEVTVYRFPGRGHMEAVMHRVFKEFRSKGEWFYANERIVRFAKKYGKEFKLTKRKRK